jgi:hypothetical protein
MPVHRLRINYIFDSSFAFSLPSKHGFKYNKMKPRLFVLAFTSHVIATTNASIQLDEILSNPASVGIPGLSTAALQQLQEFESYGGLNNCQVAVSTTLASPTSQLRNRC